MQLKGIHSVSGFRGFAAGRLAVIFGTLLLLFAAFAGAEAPQARHFASIHAVDLPAEAGETLALIRRGGPFPYSRDDIVFSNRERLLPDAPRGTYREYTVRTPGRRDRGPRRIISSRDGVLYYTDDHYRSFRRIVE
jgi:ribonuclease T1